MTMFVRESRAARAHFGTHEHAYGVSPNGGTVSFGERVAGETGAETRCKGEAADVRASTINLPSKTGACVAHSIREI